MRGLLAAGLLRDDVLTVAGTGLSHHLREPPLDHRGEVLWRDVPMASADEAVPRGVARPSSRPARRACWRARWVGR